MIDINYVKENVIKLLPIDSSLYADSLDILIGGAMNKLANEGINADVIDADTNCALDYIVCCSYQVLMDLDADIDAERMTRQYITRVNTLRTSLINV